MPRHRQGGEMHGLKVDGPVAGGLGGVQHEGDAPLVADGAHCHGVLDGAADVGAVGHDHQTGIGPDQGRDIRRVQVAGSVTGDAVEGDTLGGEIRQGPHDGVVFHTADQTVVAAFQKAPQHHIQSGGVAGSEDAVGGITVVEQPAQPFPQQQGGHTSGLGAAVYPPVDGGPHFRHILQHGLGHGRGLGEGSGAVIKINGVHGLYSDRNNL